MDPDDVLFIERLLQRARVARREDRAGEARRELTEAVRRCRDYRGPGLLLAEALAGLGQIERDRNELQTALQYYTDAANLYREYSQGMAQARAIRHAADIESELGDTVESARHYEEAVAIYRSDPSTAPLDLANALRGWALLQQQAGAKDGALELWEEARRLYAAAQVDVAVAECSRRVAELTM